MKEPDIFDYNDYRQYLEDHFAYKKSVNSYWSLGNWAQKLELNSVATLSMILKRKRHAGKNLVERLIKFFEYDEGKADYFRELVKIQKAAKGDQSLTILMIEKAKEEIPPENLDLVFNWQSYAIRELTHLAEFKEDPYYITNKLEFPIDDEYIPKLIERMLASSFLKRDENDMLSASHNSIQPTRPIEKKAAKKFHRDLLDLAYQAFNIPLDRRTFHHTTVAIKRDKFPEAKELIREFQIKFSKLLEDNEGDDVFHLNIQFYPITKK